MRRALRLHPDCHRDAISRIDVEVTRPTTDRLKLSYALTGRIAELVLPPPAEPVRIDELWKHTCFELFVQPGSGTAYYEFNFAPSTQWAAYHFDSYRDGRRPAVITTPTFSLHGDDGRFELDVALELPGYSDAVWNLGLSAVIEETGGKISYWALNHPPGNPDFHHTDCFALELNP